MTLTFKFLKFQKITVELLMLDILDCVLYYDISMSSWGQEMKSYGLNYCVCVLSWQKMGVLILFRGPDDIAWSHLEESQLRNCSYQIGYSCVCKLSWLLIDTDGWGYSRQCQPYSTVLNCIRNTRAGACEKASICGQTRSVCSMASASRSRFSSRLGCLPFSMDYRGEV